jgi:hypothetical protein
MRDLNTFNRFLGLRAARTGQPLNMSDTKERDLALFLAVRGGIEVDLLVDRNNRQAPD